MVQERREPTISTIRPERDEIASHQNRLSKRPQDGPVRPPVPPGSRPAPAKRSSLAVFAFLLALVGIGTATFSVWQLRLAQQSLTSAGDRIAELEARLNLTNTESDQSVTKIHEKLNWADTEIRKLWGVAYDTNRKAIQANKTQLDSARTQLNSVDKVAKTAAADVKKANALAGSQQTALVSLRTQSSEQQLVLSRVSEEIDALEQQLGTAIDKAAKLENQLSKLQNSLSPRVTGNEEAIKAIDAFRRTANSDIQQLKERVGASP
jgi:chromosome segregation ATPase